MLVLLARSDEQAFDILYKRHWEKVFRYALSRTGERTVAEDLCHDVFLSLWQRRASLSVRCLEAYLIQAVKYGVVGYLRTQWDKTDASLAEYLGDAQTEEAIAFKALYAAWQKAVERIPEKSREVYRLSKLQHYSNKEIAHQLALTEKAVEYHMTKALKVMRKHLKDYTYLFF